MRLLELVEPALICGEEEPLRRARGALATGRAVLVDEGGRWGVLLPGGERGHHPGRCLLGLPLLTPPVLEAEASVRAALLQALGARAPYVVVVDQGRAMGLIPLLRLLQAADGDPSIRPPAGLALVPPSEPPALEPLAGPAERPCGSVHPQDLPRLRSTMRRAARSGATLGCLCRLRDPERGWRWVYHQAGGCPPCALSLELTEALRRAAGEGLRRGVQRCLVRGEPEDALREALALLGEATSAEAAALLTLEGDRCRITHRWSSGGGGRGIGSLCRRNRLTPEARDLVELALKRGELYLPNAKPEGALADWGCLSLVALSQGERALLLLAARRPAAISPEQHGWAREVAPWLATAVGTWRRSQRLEELSRSCQQRLHACTLRLRALHGLARRLDRSLNRHQLLRRLLEGLRPVVPHEVAAGLLLTEGGGELIVRTVRPLSGETRRAIEERVLHEMERLGGHPPGEALRRELLRARPLQRGVPRLDSILHAPIPGEGGGAMGVLLVGREDSFAPQEREALRAVAVHASLVARRVPASTAPRPGRLEALVEQLPEAVLLLDARGRLRLANRAGRELLARFAPGAALGERLPRSERCPLEKVVRGLRGSGTPLHDVAPRGTQGPILEMAAQPMQAGPEVGGWVVTVRDVTDRRQAEAALREALERTIEALATTIELRDPYTAGHQRRVAELARAIAREMGLPEDRVQGIYVGALIHDLGKIAVPAEILSKPGRLSEAEFNLIRQHPRVGYEILKSIPFPWPVAQMVLQHHERLDGSGYPQGLKGDNISLEARVLAVADVVEAMSSHRPYRPALGRRRAMQELLRGSGRLYDPQVVRACLRVLERGFAFSEDRLAL